jgi:hypothetical protein
MHAEKVLKMSEGRIYRCNIGGMICEKNVRELQDLK